jgi:hypothetical protein
MLVKTMKDRGLGERDGERDGEREREKERERVPTLTQGSDGCAWQ